MSETPKTSFSGIAPDNEYARKQKAEHEQKLIADRRIAINELLQTTNIGHITNIMDYIEKVIHTCGGEPKPAFVDVSRDTIVVFTRIPMKANLYPFLPDSPENPRFHKVVTKILMNLEEVHGVSWVPNSEGAKLVVSLNRGTTNV